MIDQAMILITNLIGISAEMFCAIIMALPMIAAFATLLFYMVDDKCYRFAWYRCIMYGNEERSDTYADEFFGKAFLVLGITNLILPSIVIYGYLYHSGLSWSEFIAKQGG